MNKFDTLDWCLDIIRKNFDVQKIINEPQKEEEIKKYYLTNHLAYLLFYNKDGYLHMGITRKGSFQRSDLLEHLHIINTYIHKIKAKSVLELGPGNGSNSAYLAKNNPDVNFVGLDLSKKPLNKHKNIKNYSQRFGDFHNLDKFPDNSVDLVFVIEALCHSSDKLVVLKEVYKKLKKGGLFIIFDGYRTKHSNEYKKDELLAMQLTEKTMSVDKFDEITDFEEKIKKSHFSILYKENLSPFILPGLKKLRKKALLFYNVPILKTILRGVLSDIILRNSIAGLLMPVVVEKKLASYYLHILSQQ